ncbi:hypothetical protein MCOR25_007853 [Pyricularia grisea]|nr:hypothetical protein MCOR25_007853 [Pyricularia grisea]
MPLFADLWGPVGTVRHPDDNGKILQHHTPKGIIRRREGDKLPARIPWRSLNDGEAVVSCHWEATPKHFLSRCAGGVLKLLKPPKSFLRDGDLLLIGASEPAPEAEPGLQHNKGCQYTTNAFFADSADIQGVPGTSPDKWVKDGFEITAAIAVSVINLSFTGKTKKIQGTTLKNEFSSSGPITRSVQVFRYLTSC